MGFSLIPKDEGFQDLFEEMAGIVVLSGTRFLEMLALFDRVRERAAGLKELEHLADDVTRRIYEALDRSFLPPLEPEDIHRLAGSMDDLIDDLEETAFRFSVYLTDEPPGPSAVTMADLIQKSCFQIEQCVRMLRSQGNSEAMQTGLRELGDLENRGDVLFREMAAGFFAGTPDALAVLKWKDLYERLEGTLDRCRDVGNVITEIVLKSS